MNSIFKLTIIASIGILTSCGQGDPNNQIDEGLVENNTYTSQDIGWTIIIPNNWTIISKDKLEDNDKKGLTAIKEVYDEDFDFRELKHLISFQKDQFNAFQSTSEPFELEYEGEWEENNNILKKILYQTFTNQGTYRPDPN